MNDSIADGKVRARALDPGCSFICSAPAGSGKTELLTQRFLTLLAQVRHPESVVAITFTRKAAAEMRDRILSALKRAAQQPRPQVQHQALTWDLASKVLQVDKANQWSLLETHHRLQIKTFDSLCSLLANSLCSQTAFASSPLIAENPEEFYRKAAQALLQSLEDDQPWSSAIGQLFQLMDGNTQKLENLLASMLARREAWLPVVGSGDFDRALVIQALQKNLQRVRDETVTRLIAAIPGDHQRRLLELAGLAAVNVAREEYDSAVVDCIDLDGDSTFPIADEKGIRQWLGLAELLLTKDNRWRKTVNRRLGFPPGKSGDEKALLKQQKQQLLDLINDFSQQSGLLDLLVEIRHLPNVVYDGDQAALLCALLEILPVLIGYLQVGFKEANSVDFAEVSIRARLALNVMGSPTELALTLDYKIQHLLVDEFQDASSAQLELLTLLTAGWQLDDGRSLFLVGDPMQSIYGFRNANVGLFLQCRENGIGNISLEPLALSANFRSQAAIVTWINKVFSQSFPKRNDIAVGAVNYLPSTPIHPSLPGRAVRLHGFSEEMDATDEAHTVLDIVQKTRWQSPESKIAILVRSRRHVMRIIPMLDAAGLAYRAVDLDSLADNMIVQDLMSLTQALSHPADRIAWLSVLRAPWCGLSLQDLEALSNFCRHSQPPLTVLQQLIQSIALYPAKTQTIDKLSVTNTNHLKDQNRYPSLSVDGYARLARVAPILEACIAQIQRQPLRQWIEGAWVALGGPACIENHRDFKNAERYFLLLESLNLSTLTRERGALQQAVQTLYAEPDPNSDDRLQIMTIHKAKGLEFDTVIIPALERSLPGSDPELLRWDERLSIAGDHFLLMSPITASGKEKDAIYHHLALQDKRRQLNENIRLLYVACTRARRQLHLLAQVKIDKKDTAVLRQPPQSSLLYAAWPVLKSEIIWHQQPANTDEVRDQPKVSNYLQRLKSHWRMPKLRCEDMLADSVPYYQYDNSQCQQPDSWQDPTPRYIGVLVHRILQHLTLSELQSFNWRQNFQYWSTQLQALGVPSQLLGQATENVITALERIAADTSIHWLFVNQYLQRKTEYPVTVVTMSGVRHYIIDLFIVKDGVTWIVDYKMAQPDTHQADHQFIEQELEKYHDIMHSYKQAVACMDYKNIKLALYFPMISHFAEYK